MSDVVILAPSPVLSITIEDHEDVGDVHVHAGGQGVWQARMLMGLGCSVELCSVLSGEIGRVVGHLLADEGIRLTSIGRDGRGGVYVHDRRDGAREPVFDSGGDPLPRHELDELYGLTLRRALDAQFVILSGPAGDEVIPADFYRRLAADLRTGGVRVIVDLAGERLTAALAGGVTVAKVSEEELLADGRISDSGESQIIAAMRRLHDEGAEIVVVTRAEEPSLLLEDATVHEIAAPSMEVVDSSGAGDSFVGAFVATLNSEGSVLDAARLGAAAGAINVTRHGLGTGDAATIRRLQELVEVRAYSPAPDPPAGPAEEISPSELARRVENP